jgi:hypothetical protein
MAIADMLLQPPRRYLRYLHLREAIRLSQPENVLVIGIGRGLAEVAIAKEFHETQFHLTDWDFPHPRLNRSRKYANAFSNVTFGKLDILKPDLERKFGLVASVEVLEHIREDEVAAANMRSLSSSHVFCLVPFATPEDNANEEKRQRVWENNEHYVVGYDPARLEQLFPDPETIRGAYWSDVSKRLKSEVAELAPEQVRARGDELRDIAQQDLRPEIPQSMHQAMGIWTLSRAAA